MRIATLVKRNGADFEQRKLQLARRDMDQAYKKHAKYASASKNPMLLALENLISGKTEKELHEDIATKQYEMSEEQLLLAEKLHLPEVKQESNAHEQAHKVDEIGTFKYTTVRDSQKYVIGGELTNQAHPTNSLQDTFQGARTELTADSIDLEKDRPPFEDESFHVEIPEHFLYDVERNPKARTLFGKDLEKLLLNRTFNQAKAVYTSHIEMVKNSYRSYSEPLFSRMA